MINIYISFFLRNQNGLQGTWLRLELWIETGMQQETHVSVWFKSVYNIHLHHTFIY